MFVHSMMLAGTAAGAAPIIIHLLNRQRYKKVVWAAMHWLLAAFKKSARRLQVEDLILLIVRVLILVLLALALARPFLQQGGALLGGKAQAHRVVLLDNSFSMGYNPGGKSAFDRARDVSRKLISTETLTAGDAVTLITVTEQATARIKASTALPEVARELESTELSHSATDAVKSLALAYRLLEESKHPRKEIFIVTDLTRSGWIDPASPDQGVRSLEDLNKAVKDYAEKHKDEAAPAVYLVDVGFEKAQNLAVVSLTADASVVAAGSQVVFKARVRNFSDVEHAELPVAFGVDGETVSTSTIKAEPGKEAEAVFSYQFEAAGPHWVSAGIEGDRLAIDNVRYRAVPVIDHLKVLAVDGEMKPSPLECETGLLVQVLAPKVPEREVAQGVKSPSVINVQVIPDDALADAQFDLYDLVILANVPVVPEEKGREKVTQLKRWVKDGGGLLIFVGERLIDPSFYNETMGSGDSPLLPAKLLAAEGEAGNADAKFWSFQPDQNTDVLLPNFGKECYPLLEMVHVFRRYRVELEAPPPESAKKEAKGAEDAGKGKDGRENAPPAPDGKDEKKVDKKPPPARGRTSVPLRYSDEAPAIVVREFGLGKVALVTTTADKYWNNLPERVAHLPMIHDMVYYLVRSKGATHNLDVGGTFSIRWPPEDLAKKVVIFPPEGHEEGKKTISPETVKETEATVLRYAGLAWAGPYKAMVVGEDRPREIFAGNVNPVESDLTRIDPKELASLIKCVSFTIVNKPEELGDILKEKGVGREFWKTIAWAVLGLAVIETFLAWFFGRNRW